MPNVDLGALSSLLARDIGEIEDPPSFKTPPCGVYKWIIKKTDTKNGTKDDKSYTTINNTYVITDIIEQTEKEISASEQVKVGDMFGESFFFGEDPVKTEETLGWMKLRYMGLAEAVGTTNLLEIVEKAVGMEVQGIVGHRVDKTDKSKIYPQIRDVIPAA